MASSRWESNPGHLACAVSALPLSYDKRSTTQYVPLTVHTEWLPGVRLRHFSPTCSCAVYIEDCEGWWLSS